MKILIADDNHEFCTTIADIIASEGWEYKITNTPQDTLQYLEVHADRVGVLLLDVEFNHPTLTGIDVLERSVRNWPQIPVVMITGVGTISIAVRATQLGAMNFIEKSAIDRARLKEVLYTAMEKVNVRSAAKEAMQLMSDQGLIGRSRAMLDVADNIYRYGRTELNILILGETGTGKKLVARALHAASARNGKPFVTVDIPNIPAPLFQSELFGHTKGSFTHATEDKNGLFQQANKGTIFLDEIGDLPLELQANLLVPIEEKTVRRLGSIKSTPIDVRFVSATDRNLVGAIEEGKYREQLYHRLRECEITLPPLRDRREDIPLIVEHYTQAHNSKMDEQKMFSSAALEYLSELPWPGNVRQLENMVRVVLQTSNSDRVEVADVARVESPQPNGKRNERSNVQSFLDSGNTLREDVDMLNKIKIEDVLEANKGNVSKAAAKLGISRETLHNRIKKHGIDVSRFRRKR